MIVEIKKQITNILKKAGVKGEIELTTPPDPKMGDFSFACFDLAKKNGSNPKEAAGELLRKIKRLKDYKIIDEVKAVGPYVNFYLNPAELAKLVLKEINQDFGKHKIGKGKKYLVEFGCPNPLKAFHLGHLKNLVTGEAIARILENAGYKIIRINYQGDVGMHVAKSLWGIFDWLERFEKMKKEKDIRQRVEFLGQAYAHGAQHFEESEAGKAEIYEYNDKVYNQAPEIQAVYKTARRWSLAYFDQIYKKLGSSFDRLYFESEVTKRGVDLVNQFKAKGVFKESDGAIIYEGSKYGLHDRVFVNSKGFPTYEAKDLALAEKHFADFQPDLVLHVVGKEQADYFKVLINALEKVLSKSKGKEYHLPGGFLQLKGQQKMSSRTGNIITGDALVDFIEKRVGEIMKEAGVKDKAGVQNKVSVAALKYALLKVEATKDVAFDFEESVSLTGDSGPYLLYIVARIKSILRKAKQVTRSKGFQISDFRFQIASEEKQLLLQLAKYPEVTQTAAEQYDPSKIAKYLFDLAQLFNTFYHACPVLQAEEEEVRAFRLKLIGMVAQVMEKGLNLLGIEVVEEM
ncbi:MAG: arginine--tRNA ligase [Patescibacteria group bacterium]